MLTQNHRKPDRKRAISRPKCAHPQSAEPGKPLATRIYVIRGPAAGPGAAALYALGSADGGSSGIGGGSGCPNAASAADMAP